VRDRRWDFLCERQKQPVKQLLLERFAEELARELSTWPPPFAEWVSEELRRRHAAEMAERPRQEALRQPPAMRRAWPRSWASAPRQAMGYCFGCLGTFSQSARNFFRPRSVSGCLAS
jgi:hypothetical protein